MKTILVTGGAGFIGSTFLRAMVPRYSSYRYVNLDKLTYAGNKSNLLAIEGYKNYCFIKGDICNAKDMAAVFQDHRPFAVINFAAESHVDRSIFSAAPFVETNVLGTQVLLELSVKHKVDRFVQISTDEVYGSLEDDKFATEESSLMPNSPYAASKASADLIARSFVNTHGLDVIVSRCGNNYGERQFPEKLVPLTIIKAIQGDRIPIYGVGKNQRNWIYVEDHCKAIDLMLHHGKKGHIYNVGGDKVERNIDLVKKILTIIEKPESLISFVKDRLGHDLRYALNTTKIRRNLGWKPSYDLDKGLRKTIQWYLHNEQWYAHLYSSDSYKTYYESQYSHR